MPLIQGRGRGPLSYSKSLPSAREEVCNQILSTAISDYFCSIVEKAGSEEKPGTKLANSLAVESSVFANLRMAVAVLTTMRL